MTTHHHYSVRLLLQQHRHRRIPFFSWTSFAYRLSLCKSADSVRHNSAIAQQHQWPRNEGLGPQNRVDEYPVQNIDRSV